ncbi:MAG TPA: tetratricopeptide repeat protein [Candidatus Polarisedimenticolaceae bacterium]|nr:tetratricopeptide repeat protein [Candidatus Polarisedimenticolaceae bacterium]
MATAKITKKQLEQDEFLERVFDLGEWFEVHWKRVAIAVGIAIALVLVVVAWNSSRERASEEANRLLAQGLAAFAPDANAGGQTPPPRYAEALPLFEQAADKGGTTAVGDVARYFRAQALIAVGRASDAVPVLEALASGGNERIAATAKVSLAAALEASGNAERAASVLQELAAAPPPGTYPPDAALMLLSELRERQGRSDDARKACEDLLARFPQSPFAAEARQRLGAAAPAPAP